MPATTRLGKAGADLLVCLLLLAACTGDPTAEPRQEVSATRTEPSWPPASVLSLPEPTSPDPAMGRDAKARVVAYAVHLVDQVQYALRTTFPAAVLRSDAFCQICSQINDLAAEAHQDQEVYDFDDWSVQVLQMRELPDDPEVRYWKVRTLLDQPELTARDSSGDVVGTIPARRRQTVLVVGHTDNEWVIYEWRVVEDAPGSTA